MHRVRVYIDGFNLYYGIHAVYGRRYLWLDVEALAEAMLRPGQQLDRIGYFTAKIRDAVASERRQDIYLEALRARSTCLDIIEGRSGQRDHRCRSCGVGWRTYEEKATDVGAATALVEDAARDAYDTALVVSGDSDLCPAVRAAKRLAPDRKVVAVFPPKRQSDPLRYACDGILRIDRGMLRRAQLPATVVTPDGMLLARPRYWA